MERPSLSIVIPTHHRPAILNQTLEHVATQTIADQLEVIVVHDGEDDEDTKELFPKILNSPCPSGRREFSLPVRQAGIPNYSSIPKSHQGVARNRGVEKASAPLVLFIGDDIFLTPDSCELHLKAHEALKENSQFAVLGHTTWDPALTITPVMRWLERTGWQFGYPLIERYAHDFIPRGMQERFTYTSHISVPTEVARKFPFREDVTLYGWEDILWGQQLKEAGVPLFYEPDARALHHHQITLEDSLRRMETLGRSLRQLEAVAPQLHRSPHGLKMLAYRIGARTPTIRGRHYRAFVRGLDAGY